MFAANQAELCGNSDYDSADPVLSTSRSGLSTLSRTGALQDYLDNADDLQNGSVETPGSLRWRYPTGTNPRVAVAVTDRNYIDVRAIVRPRDNDNLTDDLTADGLMALELEVTASDTATPVFQNIRERFQRLSIGFCVTDEATSPTALFPASGCGSGEGQTLIQYVRRDSLLP